MRRADEPSRAEEQHDHRCGGGAHGPPGGPSVVEGIDPDLEMADWVIHRLFGIGLVMQSIASLDRPGSDPAIGAARGRLDHAVQELDQLIRDIRTVASAEAGHGRSGDRGASRPEGPRPIQVRSGLPLAGSSDAVGSRAVAG